MDILKYGSGCTVLEPEVLRLTFDQLQA